MYVVSKSSLHYMGSKFVKYCSICAVSIGFISCTDDCFSRKTTKSPQMNEFCLVFLPFNVW